MGNTVRLLIVVAVLAVVCPARAQDVSDLIDRARRDARADRYDDAEADLRLALPIARGDERNEVRYRLAALLRDADEATTLYREIVDDDPGGEWAKRACLELAKIQYALGNYSQAYSLLSDSDACDVSDEACLFSGLSAIMLERFGAARAPLERVRQGRLRTWAFMSLAEVDMGLDHPEQACDRYASLASALISPTALYRHGECLEDRGDVAGARREYREIIRSFRDTPEAVLAAEKLQLIQEPSQRTQREKADERALVPESHEGVARLEEGFTLQFGSFRDRGNAIKMAAKIKRVYPGVRIDSELVNYREYHRVRYGYFHTRDEARAKGEEIAKQINIDYTIMTLP